MTILVVRINATKSKKSVRSARIVVKLILIIASVIARSKTKLVCESCLGVDE
jgi:hypothetical protein